ncbi:hypothetical protein [Pseudomonas farris]
MKVSGLCHASVNCDEKNAWVAAYLQAKSPESAPYDALCPNIFYRVNETIRDPFLTADKVRKRRTKTRNIKGQKSRSTAVQKLLKSGGTNGGTQQLLKVINHLNSKTCINKKLTTSRLFNA